MHRWRCQLRRLVRCDGCRGHYDQATIKVIHRTQAPGDLRLCGACWWDILQAVRYGGHDMGALLEQLAAAGVAGPR